MKGILTCRACSSGDVEQFFDLGMQPFANALVMNDNKCEYKYPLSLSYCKNCSLVQLDYTADPKELFSNYFWVTSTSQSAREYSEIFCESALSRIESGIPYVLEVASNDGTFLKPFKKRGYNVLGIDPALNIAKMAAKEGIPTKNEFFGESVACKAIEEYGYPGIVFARNVLPHVANLHDFLKGLKTCMNEGTLLVLEVHYAGKILDELHYDSIYHEHLCYFSVRSLQNLLKKYDLHAFDIIQSPISGGSIVLYISLDGVEKSEQLIGIENNEAILGYNSFDKWTEFSKKSYHHKKILNEVIDTKIREGKKIIGYGASARSSTMLNFCGIDNSKISKIADQNSLKHGLLTPGTHIPIVHPDEAFSEKPEAILLLAWNFKDEIIRTITDNYGFKGEIIIPLPFPPEVVNVE